MFIVQISLNEIRIVWVHLESLMRLNITEFDLIQRFGKRTLMRVLCCEFGWWNVADSKSNKTSALRLKTPLERLPKCIVERIIVIFLCVWVSWLQAPYSYIIMLVTCDMCLLLLGNIQPVSLLQIKTARWKYHSKKFYARPKPFS